MGYNRLKHDLCISIAKSSVGPGAREELRELEFVSGIIPEKTT